ncbi:hypothetical protein HHE02_05100 [Helicobacter heilmannii]|nr:hypothetical protein HHE02_05100 [Helicobacter heilmannii]
MPHAPLRGLGLKFCFCVFLHHFKGTHTTSYGQNPLKILFSCYHRRV